MNFKLTIIFLACIFFVIKQSSAQTIDLIHGDLKSDGDGVKKFGDGPHFRQGNIDILGDLILVYQAERRFEVIGHAKIIQGSTTITSQTLTYFGGTKEGKFRQNVKVLDNGTVLETEFLDFNAETSQGHFYNGGKVVDSASILTCKTGYFYSAEKLYFFKDDVVLTNDKYVMHSDTLKYQTVKKIAYVFGPTTITSKTDYIYCENGWYDTQNDIAQFNKKAILKNNKQQLTGDSLYYDRQKGIGKSFTNVMLWDSTENIYVSGGYAVYYQKPEKALIYKNALFRQVSNLKDTLYLHADTLRSDYNEKGNYKTIKAYRRAQMFRADFQSRCDSLFYSFQDSTIKFYVKPILWANENQITGDSIRFYTKNNKPSRVEIDKTAIIASEESPKMYNQIKGLGMTGYFTKSELTKLTVNSNANSLYYARDKKDLIGLNKVECGKMSIYFKDRKLQRIMFHSKPVASLIPLSELKVGENTLEGFTWFDAVRPKKWTDIFTWKK
jgi:lipopolysaccharide export system protein LptA